MVCLSKNTVHWLGAVSELEAWRALGDAAPDVGDMLEVVVHAVHADPIFRFPLQLMPADPALAARVPAAESHLPPLDMQDVPLSEYASVAERTGRRWAPQKVVVPASRDDQTPHAYQQLSDEELQEIDDLAAGVY